MWLQEPSQLAKLAMANNIYLLFYTFPRFGSVALNGKMLDLGLLKIS